MVPTRAGCKKARARSRRHRRLCPCPSLAWTSLAGRFAFFFLLVASAAGGGEIEPCGRSGGRGPRHRAASLVPGRAPSLIRPLTRNLAGRIEATRQLADDEG